MPDGSCYERSQPLLLTLMTRLHRFLPVLLILLFPLTTQAQWPRGTGQGYAQISLGTASATDGFNANRNLGTLGSADNPEEFHEVAFYAYAEYGLNAQWTLIASTFGKSMEAENRTDRFSTSGLSDVTLQLRYSLPQFGSVVVSPQVGVKLPTGYDATAAPPLGSGARDWMGSLQVGISFYPFPGYAGLSAGYRQRGGIPQDEVYGHLEAGVFVDPSILLRLRLDFIESTTNDSDGFTILNQVPEQGYVTVGPGFSVMLGGHWQIHIDPRWTVAGRTTAQIVNVIAGVAYVW